MTSPYPGNTYGANPQAGPLTGAEVVPLLQSGRNRWTLASTLAAMVSGIAAGVTEITAGQGITGGVITSTGTIAVDIGHGLAFSGNQVVTTGANLVASVFTRTGSVVATSGDYNSAQVTESGNLYYTDARVTSVAPNVTVTGQNYLQLSGQQITINPITLSGANVAGNLPFANIQSANPTTLIGNPTGATSVPSQITLGANLSFSGTTLVAAGGVGTVAQVSTGSGLTGGPITSSGTLSVVLGSGLAFSGNQIINTSGTAGAGTVTQISAGSGLTGGPLTSSGTLSVVLGSGLSFSGNQIINASAGNAGTVTQISTGTGLTGGPVTSSGTISFSAIAPSSLWSNISTATSTPVVTTLGPGLAFSGTTIINTSGAADGVLQISTGTGLTGGPITSSGTIWITDKSVGNLQLATGAVTATSIASGSVTNTSLAVGAVTATSIASGAVTNTSLAVGAVTVTTIAAGAITNTSLATGIITATSLAIGSVGVTALASNAVTTTTISNSAVSYAKIQNAAATTLLGNSTAGSTAVTEITLGAGLGFSGTTIINLSGAVDGVSSLTFQSGLSGGTITGTGTVGISNNAITNIMLATGAITNTSITAGSITNTALAAGSVTVTTLASGCVTNTSLAAGIITATALAAGSVGVTALAANAVTTTTISNSAVTYAKIQNASAVTLIGNSTAGSTSVQEITLGANLSFSGTTLVAAGGASGAGTVTQISTGTGLTGGPLTSSGTLQFATIAANSLWANVSNGTLTPVVTTIGTGLAFSGASLTLSGSAISKQYTQITGAPGTIALDSNAAFPYVVNTIRGAMTSTGSITANFQISGVSISGLGAVVITTTAQTITGTASNLVSTASRLTVVFTSNTSAANIEFTIGATRNG